MRHSTVEICGTCENSGSMDPSPPPDPNETNWIVQVEESLKSKTSDDQRRWNKRSIYRIPARITDLKSEAYRPQVVSFGPYHHGDEHLLPMEEHKRRSLVHFLKRSGKPFKPFLESLKEVLGDLKASYDALDPMWKKDSEGAAGRFLQLMITDGCFMLEILRFANSEVDDYAPNDPIFSNHGRLYILPNIWRDMLLLENQLPLLVLERLVAVCNGKKEEEYINRLILNFWRASENNPSTGKCLHVLDVFRKKRVQLNPDQVVSMGNLNNACMGTSLDVSEKSLPMESKENKEWKSNASVETIPPATELREHGIQFKQSETNSLKEISFASGVLRLPVIVVDDDTESMFLNLIAFERFHVEAGTEVTSYICFMDNLIDKERDFALLRKKGIIRNYMESDEAAAKLFNLLAKDVMLDPGSRLHDMIKKVKEYCKERRHKWRASLMHTHFRNPWVILSLIAAFLLFGLTIIQTIYTVLG
ncbi:UPF0481 protein At3g47200-like [Rhodamnia argentea]|uniref:UPF0481 protein At3g47200-like n=1 Tax=Rhodamnia argentea TaxID=178133 RepID=A0ABM3HS35_9MYRT|nr:UPF0481 protein At3g47200-like [Rhodamnia argentea]